MNNVFVSTSQAMKMNAQFVDCRHDLSDPKWGRQQYKKEHIAGAVFAHLDEDLSGNINETTGRHPLPKIENFHEYIQSQGLSPEKYIIGYDNFGGGIAARLWWMLKQIGFEHVYIMTNGIDRWKKEGGSISTNEENIEEIKFNLEIKEWSAGPYKITSMNKIQQNIPNIKLIDSRSPKRYKGKEEPYDKIPGRIPGAINIHWKSNLEADELSINSSAFNNLEENEISNYTVYCGSGVTACFNLAVFEELGLPRPKYYPGSYSEWVRNNPKIIETEENIQSG